MKTIRYLIAVAAISVATFAQQLTQPTETALPSASVTKVKKLIHQQREMTALYQSLFPQSPVWKHRREAIDAVLLVIEQEQLRLDEEAARARGVSIVADEDFVMEFPAIEVTAKRNEVQP